MRLKRIRKRFSRLLQSAGASYYESKISMKQLKVDFSKPCAWSYIIYLFFNSSKFDRENNYVHRRRKNLKVLKIYVHRYIIRNNQPRCLLSDIMSSETETNGEKKRKIKKIGARLLWNKTDLHEFFSTSRLLPTYIITYVTKHIMLKVEKTAAAHTSVWYIILYMTLLSK